MLRWFVLDFMRTTVDQTINQGSEDLYNQRCEKMFETFKDFLVMHYQGGRTDSEFWKHISSGATSTEFVKTLKESCKTRVPTLKDFDNFWGSAGWPLWSYVLSGTSVLTPEIVQQEIEFYHLEHYSKQIFNDTEEHLKNTFSGLTDNTTFINSVRNGEFK
jgi:hypothetical protein